MLTLTTEPQSNLTFATLAGLEAFAPFAQRSLTELLDFGQKMARLLESCTTPEAKKAFHDWAAQRYGKKFAEKAIALWRWWSELTGEIQQQIQQIPLSYWPISTALSLMKLGERLGGCLGAIADLPSVTVSRLENLIRRFVPKRPAPLRLGKTASDADWEYAQKKLGFSDGELDALQRQAESLAAIDVETGEKILTTDVIVEALEASGYDANLVLWKEHHFERQLASREQELESEKQARLDAQAQVNQNYAQLRAAQVEVKEQQAQLQEQEAEIEQNQAEIAQLRQQLAELQRQSSGQEVADTSGETDGSQEDSLATEIAVPVASAVITEEEEIPNLKQITPEPETGEPLVTSNDTEIARPRQQIAEVEQEANRLNAASALLPASTPARPQKKRKRKGGIFQAEMARLGIRC